MYDVRYVTYDAAQFTSLSWNAQNIKTKYYLSRTYELRTIYDAFVKQTPASEYLVRDKWALFTKSVTYEKT